MILKINGNKDYNQYFRAVIGLLNLNSIYMNYSYEMINRSFIKDLNKTK